MAIEMLSRPKPHPTRILDEKIIQQQGSFKRVKQYLEGWHPELGTLSFGLSGQETIVEKTMIQPIEVFQVENRETQPRLIFSSLFRLARNIKYASRKYLPEITS